MFPKNNEGPNVNGVTNGNGYTDVLLAEFNALRAEMLILQQGENQMIATGVTLGTLGLAVLAGGFPAMFPHTPNAPVPLTGVAYQIVPGGTLVGMLLFFCGLLFCSLIQMQIMRRNKINHIGRYIAIAIESELSGMRWESCWSRHEYDLADLSDQSGRATSRKDVLGRQSKIFVGIAHHMGSELSIAWKKSVVPFAWLLIRQFLLAMLCIWTMATAVCHFSIPRRIWPVIPLIGVQTICFWLADRLNGSEHWLSLNTVAFIDAERAGRGFCGRY